MSGKSPPFILIEDAREARELCESSLPIQNWSVCRSKHFERHFEILGWRYHRGIPSEAPLKDRVVELGKLLGGEPAYHATYGSEKLRTSVWAMLLKTKKGMVKAAILYNNSGTELVVPKDTTPGEISEVLDAVHSALIG